MQTYILNKNCKHKYNVCKSDEQKNINMIFGYTILNETHGTVYILRRRDALQQLITG